MRPDKVSKPIELSPHIFDLLESRARAVGVTIPEYIIFLAVNDISREYIEELSGTELEDVTTSVEEIKQGKFTIVDPMKPGALTEFLRS